MLVTDTAPPRTAPADNAPEHRLPPEERPAGAGVPPTDVSKPAIGDGRGLLSAGSTGVVLLPIVLRDVAVATAGVSALLAAAGIVRRRPARA